MIGRGCCFGLPWCEKSLCLGFFHVVTCVLLGSVAKSARMVFSVVLQVNLLIQHISILRSPYMNNTMNSALRGYRNTKSEDMRRNNPKQYRTYSVSTGSCAMLSSFQHEDPIAMKMLPSHKFLVTRQSDFNCLSSMSSSYGLGGAFWKPSRPRTRLRTAMNMSNAIEVLNSPISCSDRLKRFQYMQ